LIAVASQDYLAQNPVRSVEDLAGHRCLVFSATENRAEWIFAREEVVRRVTVTGPLAMFSFSALLNAARSGQGVTWIPEPLSREWLARGDLVRVLPEWASPEFPLYVVHRSGHERIARVAAVLRAIRAHSWFSFTHGSGSTERPDGRKRGSARGASGK
jgi:DNA-binding transcriptional LysR family regulator